MDGRSHQTVLCIGCVRAEACSCLETQLLKSYRNTGASHATGTLQYQFYSYKAGKLSYQIHKL